MKLGTKAIMFISVLFLINVTVVGQIADSLLLIKDNEITGWVEDTDSICNTGFAQDCTSLYDAIDGGADVYIDRGFVSGSYKGYTDGSNIICLEIFDQGSATNAYLVYHYFGTTIGGYYNVSDLGDSAHIDTNYLSDTYIELIKNNFFIRLVCPKDAQYIQTAITMAQRVVEKSVPIIYNPKISMGTNNKLTKISVYPSNGNFMFKISLKTDKFSKSDAPSLSIYNSKGILIQRLLIHPFGSQNFIAIWDLKNDKSMKVAPGIYTAMILNGDIWLSKKFVIGL